MDIPLLGRLMGGKMTSDKVLNRLMSQLNGELKDELGHLHLVSKKRLKELDPSLATVRLVAEIGQATADLRKGSEPIDLEALLPCLQALSVRSTEALDELSSDFATGWARARLKRISSYLDDAQHHVARLVDDACQKPASNDLHVIAIPTDLLFQMQLDLMPAERMMVVGGRTAANVTRLGSAWDVTAAGADTHCAHVRADPSRLAQALIRMDQSGSHLAAWFHSHPGTGAMCVSPSSTDTNQHANWIKDYTPDLVSGIFVEDGFFRLWGTAIESGSVEVSFQGTGVSKEGKQHVYRIER